MRKERRSGRTHSKNERSGSKRTRNALKLTETLKSLIRKYIIQSDERPGDRRWVGGLFQSLRKYDARIEEQDVKRWIRSHAWIGQEAHHQSQKVPNTNTGPSDAAEVPARQSQTPSNQTDQGSASGIQVGGNSSASTSTSAPATSDSQRRLKKLQKAMEVILELKLLMEDDDLQECRAHIEVLKPLIKSLTQGQKSILSPMRRAELYQRSLNREEEETAAAAHSSGGPTSRKRSNSFVKVEPAVPQANTNHHLDDEEGQDDTDLYIVQPDLITL